MPGVPSHVSLRDDARRPDEAHFTRLLSDVGNTENIMTTGFRDTATCQENHQRFINRIVENEIVWALSNSNGYAIAESNKDEHSGIILFWSDEAYARRAQTESFPEYEESTIPLFDFLYRWLPGMSGDGVLAGTNWTGDLVGLEFDPYELRSEIEAALSEEQSKQFKETYEKLMK
jgi:hypothetical protein